MVHVVLAIAGVLLSVTKVVCYATVPMALLSIVGSHSEQVEGRLALAIFGWFVLWCMT